MPTQTRRVSRSCARAAALVVISAVSLSAGSAGAEEPDVSARASLIDALPAAAQAVVIAQTAPPPEKTGPDSAAPTDSASQTLTLEQAHAIALQNHPGIAAADYRAQAAGEAYKQARA